MIRGVLDYYASKFQHQPLARGSTRAQIRRTG